MPNATARVIQSVPTPPRSGFSTLLNGYRFRVCEDEESAGRAIAVRGESSYESGDGDLATVDGYDTRSWLLIAEHVASGEAVGTLRITPRLLGPLEAEEHFTLPRELALPKCFELSRLAIVRRARSSAAVATGLFKLAYEFCLYMGSECQVACADTEGAVTYRSFGFRDTGTSTAGGAERALLAHDFRRAGTTLRGNPFHELFCDLDPAEVVLPARTPRLGLAAESSEPSYRLAVGA